MTRPYDPTSRAKTGTGFGTGPEADTSAAFIAEMAGADSIPPEDCTHPDRVARPGAHNFFCRTCETWVGPETLPRKSATQNHGTMIIAVDYEGPADPTRAIRSLFASAPRKYFTITELRNGE